MDWILELPRDMQRECFVMEAYACTVDQYLLQEAALDRLAANANRSLALVSLYEENGLSSDHLDMPFYEEGEDKKKGIIKKIWDSIIAMFTKVKTFLVGDKLGKIPDEAEADVPADLVKTTSKLDGLTSKLKGVNVGNIVKTCLAVVVAAVAIITGLKFLKEKEKKELAMNHITGRDAKRIGKMYGVSADAVIGMAQKLGSFDVDAAAEGAAARNFQIAKQREINASKNAAASIRPGIINRKEKKKLKEGFLSDAAAGEKCLKDYLDNVSFDGLYYMKILGSMGDAAKNTPATPSTAIKILRSVLAELGKLAMKVAPFLISAFGTAAKVMTAIK